MALFILLVPLTFPESKPLWEFLFGLKNLMPVFDSSRGRV